MPTAQAARHLGQSHRPEHADSRTGTQLHCRLSPLLPQLGSVTRGQRVAASHCHQCRGGQKMPEAPVGWTLVNAGERRDKMRGRGVVPALEQGPGCCRHALCRRPSSWRPVQGARTGRVPASLSCPAYWLPGATGLGALRTVSLAPPHTPHSGQAIPAAQGQGSVLSPQPQDPD